MQSILLRRLALRQVPSATATRARWLASQPPKPTSVPKPEPPKPPPPPPESSTAPPSPTSLSLDFSPSAQEEPARTGARSSKDSLSTIERRRRIFLRLTMAAFGVGCVAGGVYLGREWTEEELKERRLTFDKAPSTRLGRTKVRFMDIFNFFSEPQWKDILPTLQPPYQKPYTLILSIDDLLVTSTWDRQNGWRTAKRPGVDYFLAYLAQFYEIVIFTSQYYYTALPIVEKLDPYGFYIVFKLFREATRSVDGKVVKDLSYLNRDLSRVIMVDTDPEHVSLQPENSIIMPKWKGDPRDRGLISMIPFLESIAIYNPPDIRPIIKNYQGKDIPIEYAKQEAEAKQKFLEELKRTGRKSSGSFTLSSLFGGSGDPSQVPMTYLELRRQEAQQAYTMEQQYIKDNKTTLEKMLEDDREAAMASMTGNMWDVFQTMAGLRPIEPVKPSQPPAALPPMGQHPALHQSSQDTASGSSTSGR